MSYEIEDGAGKRYKVVTPGDLGCKTIEDLRKFCELEPGKEPPAVWIAPSTHLKQG